MLVPLSWLQDYIDLHESPEELRDLLTFSGLEVEAIETRGSSFEGIRVGKITKVASHPNADRLTLCTVETGDGEPETVVCGAPNVREGLLTVYAPVGVELPNGLKLKKAKIRGVESRGMLCAEDELGLSGDHSGILELPETLVPGTPVVEIFGGPEIIFDLEVTPNRPDCLSLIGVARELAALTGRELRMPDTVLPEPEGDETMAVDIRNPDACPRYTARRLGGVEVAPSPDWMQNRLRLCGVRPINNLVDITNYVMLETGQPLHAFDRDRFAGDAVIVRNAEPSETLRTLDDEERELLPSDLVIADANGPVALAGVMGGGDSEILDSTRDVLLESAGFAPSGVRATAKRLDLHTESSHRFARGCDVTGVEWAGRRAAVLMIAHAGARLLGPVADEYPRKPAPVDLSCHWKTVTDLIGVDIPVDRMRKTFQKLELEILEETGEGCTVRVPGFRLDLTRPVDLTEEIARLNGLDNIPAPAPRARIIPGAEDHKTRVEMRVWRHLARRGFLEILNYSLTSSETLDGLDEPEKQRRVVLPNPITRDQSVLRSSLLPQMVETLAFNKAHQIDELALFEAGTVYLGPEEHLEERTRVALGTMGPYRRAPLDKQRPVEDAEAFFDLKGELEQLFHLLDCADDIQFRPSSDPAFAPGQGAELVRGSTTIGRAGLLADSLKRARKLTGPVALAEVEFDALRPKAGRMPVMKPVPGFPSVTRDVALIVDRSRAHADVMDVIGKKRPAELESVEMFDLFESDKLGKNRKSMAYRFTYRSSKKTLTDKAVEKMHEKIVARLVSELDASIAGR